VSVITRFQIPSKKKITRWKIGKARRPRHVSETGNEVTGKHVLKNGHWLVCSVRCDTILLKLHIGTVYSSSAQFWPSAYLLSTTHSKDVRFTWVTLYKNDWCSIEYYLVSCQMKVALSHVSQGPVQHIMFYLSPESTLRATWRRSSKFGSLT
jgi:hypothetical protein